MSRKQAAAGRSFRSRVAAIIELLEERRLLTVVVTGTPTTTADQAPIVNTFDSSQILNLPTNRDFQSLVAIVQTQPGGAFVTVGEANNVGGREVATIAEFNPDGTTKTSFGTAGTKFFSVNPAGDTWATGVQVASNGNIFVAGTSTNKPGGSSSAWVLSLTSTGALNTGFNGNGFKSYTFGTGNSSATGLLLQPTTNKLDLIGNFYNPAPWTGGVGVAQMFTSGAPDLTFNHTGIFSTSVLPGKDEYATAGVLNPKGGLYLSGTQYNLTGVGSKLTFSSSTAEIFSIKPTGGLDTTFGVGGRAQSMYVPGLKYAFGNDLALDLHTNFPLLAGSAANGLYGNMLPYGAPSNAIAPATMSYFGVDRFNLLGKHDSTFAYQKLNFGAGYLSEANVVHSDLSGGVTMEGMAGIGATGATSNAVGRLLSTGAPNTFFSTSGTYRETLSGRSSSILADAYMPHLNALKFTDYYYSYYVGRASSSASKSSSMLGWNEYRYFDPAFKLSPVIPTFGTNGFVKNPYSGISDGSAIDVGGNRIYAGGDTAVAGGFKSAIVSAYDFTGTLVPSFGTKGTVTYSLSSNGDTTISALRYLNSGDILVAGNYLMGNSGSAAYIMDLMPNGMRRMTFGTGGIKTFNVAQFTGITGLDIESTGKIDYSGGYFNTSTLSGGAFVGRLNPNGVYDPTFGTNGVMLTNPGFGKAEFASSIVAKPGGDIYLGATQLTEGLVNFMPAITGASMEVIALKGNGIIDSSYGVGGRAVAAFAGYKFTFGTRIRLNPLTNFAVLAGTAANGLFGFGTPLPIGAPGSAIPAATSARIAVARWNLAGHLDTTLNGIGMETINLGTGYLGGASSLEVFPDGGIFLAGGAILNHGPSAIVRVRLHSDGSFDATFPGAGISITAEPQHSIGPFDYVFFPVYNAANVLSYFYGFYTGHDRIDSELSDFLLGTDFMCDF